MSTNPDINMAQGFVTSEPTEDSIKLYANDVDITDKLGGGISGTDAWKGRFQNIAFIYYDATSDVASDVMVVLPQATILGSAEGHSDAETGDFTVEFGDWMTEDSDPIPDELAPYATAVQDAIYHDFLVAHKIGEHGRSTWCLPDLTITTAYHQE